jgi:hypothetical protein
MTYWCSWLRLMVASAGEANRCSMKNRLSYISALFLLPQRWYPSWVHLAVVVYVGAISSHNWIWTKCFLEEASMLVLRAKVLYWFLSLLTTLSSATL